MTIPESSRIVSKDLLASRTALLTAATSGIGAESARQLADAGAAAIVINGRNEANGRRMLAQLQEHAPATRFYFVQGDVTDTAAARSVFEEAARRLGRLDIYVHCAGAQIKPDLFVNADPATFEPLMDGHFNCILHCCHHAVALMREAGGGSIVTIASDAGKIARPARRSSAAQKPPRSCSRARSRSKSRASVSGRTA
jgi:2-hydroxycyclohexanecarboxyl-CoA dehydrogenase